MPKTVKGKYITLTEEEYKSIVKEGNEYRIPIVGKRDSLTKEEENSLFVDLKQGFSQQKICEKYNISQSTFRNICVKNYSSVKIVEIREKIGIENAKKQTN